MGKKEFIPEVWSTLLLKSLEKKLVYASCCNTDYEGDIRGKGDKLRIIEAGPVTINKYSKDSDLVYQEINDASQELEITEAESWSFKVDDVENYQASAKLLQPTIDNAAYALKDTIDQYISSFHTEAGITANLGTDTTPLEINSGNVSETLISMSRKMDDGKIPREGRWCVIPPWMLEDLIICNIATATQNTDLIANGLVARYAGFELKLSNNCPNTASAKYKILAGYPGSITFALQLTKTETIRLEKTFGDGVRGVAVYGLKVTRPGSLICLTANEAAES